MSQIRIFRVTVANVFGPSVLHAQYRPNDGWLFSFGGMMEWDEEQ